LTEPFDINSLIAKGAVAITEGERDDERANRLLRENREHIVDVWKGCIIFGIVVISYVLVL
jgi:t-SNARE complex subunit (syntaxin)